MEDRQHYNLQICEMLKDFFLKPENKDVRFFQALVIMNTLDYIIEYTPLTQTQEFKDPFNKESKQTYDKIHNFLKSKK